MIIPFANCTTTYRSIVATPDYTGPALPHAQISLARSLRMPVTLSMEDWAPLLLLLSTAP